MIYPLFAGLGPREIIVIVLIIVLLFGAKKIPELMRGMGRGVKEFKDAVNGDGIVGDKDEEKNEEKK
jgi:sec-independent protein translocase protein TatA